MKRVLWILAFAMGIGVAAAAEPAAGLVFGQAYDALDPVKHTTLAIKTNWREYKGREVTWSGVVFDVDGDSSDAKILVADKSRPLYKGYNIEVVTEDVAKAAKLQRGQTVHFKGLLDDYDTKDTGVVLEVAEAQLQ